jgi:hypothetical protein
MTQQNSEQPESFHLGSSIGTVESLAAKRFARTFCSQCGGEFGSGNEGFSHCSDHSGPVRLGLEQAQEQGCFDVEEWEHPCPFRGEPTMTPAGEPCSACGLRESDIDA